MSLSAMLPHNKDMRQVKEHIRTIFYIAMLLWMTAACSENGSIAGDDSMSLTFTAVLGVPDDGTTRTTFTPGFTGENKGKLLLAWENTETITLLTTNAAQTVIGRTFDFTGNSSNGVTCQFNGITIKKADDEKYSYFYPPIKPTYTDAANLTGGDFIIDYSQQTQLGNSTTAHLKNYYPLYWADPENAQQGVPYAAVFHIGVDLPNKGTLSKVVLRKKEGATSTLANNFKFSTKTNSTTGPITLNVKSDMANTRWDVYMVVGPCHADDLQMDLYTQEFGDNAPLASYELTSNRTGADLRFEAGKVYHYNSTEMMPDPSFIEWVNLGLYEKLDENGHWVITTPEDADATHMAYIADRNIGALYRYDTGYFFAWGDPRPKTVSSINNYSQYDLANNQYTVMPDYICGDVNYDPATYYIGPDCRMMTEAEARFLSDTGTNTAVTFPDGYNCSIDYVQYFDYDSQEHYMNYLYKPLIIKSTGAEVRFYMNGMVDDDGYTRLAESTTWIGELYQGDIGYPVKSRALMFGVHETAVTDTGDPFWHQSTLGMEYRSIAFPVRAIKMVPINNE